MKRIMLASFAAVALAGCSGTGIESTDRYSEYLAMLEDEGVTVIDQQKAIEFGDRICRIWERDPATVEEAGTESGQARHMRTSAAFKVEYGVTPPGVQVADTAEAVAVTTLCPETMQE